MEESQAEIIAFELPEIYADELQIRQLFQNLISNAIKFRNPQQAPVIKVSAVKNEAHWQFAIEDNGIGFEMKYKEQVFQLFSRLHSQDKYPGTGIGLAVCAKIVERHAGKIWAESEGEGKGTIVTFTLPIS